jgi:hypothetical protein
MVSTQDGLASPTALSTPQPSTSALAQPLSGISAKLKPTSLHSKETLADKKWT